MPKIWPFIPGLGPGLFTTTSMKPPRPKESPKSGTEDHSVWAYCWTALGPVSEWSHWKASVMSYSRTGKHSNEAIFAYLRANCWLLFGMCSLKWTPSPVYRRRFGLQDADLVSAYGWRGSPRDDTPTICQYGLLRLAKASIRRSSIPLAWTSLARIILSFAPFSFSLLSPIFCKWGFWGWGGVELFGRFSLLATDSTTATALFLLILDICSYR